MPDYEGVLIFDGEDELRSVVMPMFDSLILEEDSSIFVDSYEPAEGCSEA
jgi:hypothetical protein